MSHKEIKRISVRLYFENEADLIDRAINTSGITQAEWCRRSLMQSAEFQIHGGKVDEFLLKNLLLIRRLMMRSQTLKQSELEADKKWARDETERLINCLKIGGNDDNS